MARLLFCVDHTFLRAPDGTVYTSGGKFPYAKWQEYLNFFDEVIVLARGKTLSQESATLSVSSGERVAHRLMDDLRGWRRVSTLRQQQKAVRRFVGEADAVAGRIPSEIGLAACGEAKRAGLPYLVELVACPWDALWNHGSFAARLYAPLLTWRTRSCVREARLVHYVTEYFLQRRYPTNGLWIAASNVMLQDRPPETETNRHARIASLYQGRQPIFGTIGSLHTRLKGVSTALESLASVKEPFEYRVLGEGDPAELMRKSRTLDIAEQVHFDGTLPGGEAVGEWLDRIDIYLQPSFQEGLPRAMIEAMNQGLPALGSNVGGISELLRSEAMHEPGDSEGLAALVRRLRRLPEAAFVEESARSFAVADRYTYVRSSAIKNRMYRMLREWAERGWPGSAGTGLNGPGVSPRARNSFVPGDADSADV